MAIEIVSFPIKNCDFPYLCKRLPEGTVDHPKQVRKTPDIFRMPGRGQDQGSTTGRFYGIYGWSSVPHASNMMAIITLHPYESHESPMNSNKISIMGPIMG